MANALATVLLHIQRLAANRCPRTDGELLDRFSANRDEMAFTALVARHGPMVLRVCRRALHHKQDAEDAFQAAFLVLARSTTSIRNPEVLADWLHGVAYRTAMKAKRSAARRRNHETRQSATAHKRAASPAWDDVQAVLDEEIHRLAEPFRSAFVLCVLEGRTQSQAALALKVKEGTVSSRLARARQRLQQQLARRGIMLSALLAALSVVENGVKAGVPAILAQGAVRYGLLAAAGRTVAGQIPSHVAALAAGVTRAMILTKAKIATAVLFAAALCSGAAMLAHKTLAGPGARTSANQKSAAPAAKERVKAAKDEDSQDAVTYTGQVLGPGKKPVAGGKVYYHFITHEDEVIPERAITDAQGRFTFTLTRKDVPLSADTTPDTTRSDPLKTGQIVVKADGFTIAWLSMVRAATDLTFEVAEDATPVEGRLLDLQGKPLAGVRVSTLSAWAPQNGNLGDFLKDLRAGKPFYEACSNLPNYLASLITGRNLARFLPSAVTDGNGRFRLHGFAKEQLVELRIEGESIETQGIYVLTRAKPAGAENLLNPIRVKDLDIFGPPERYLVRWNGFDHTAPPGQVVVGTVRDKATKAPIPGAIVESYMLAGTNLAENTIYQTVADAGGRYRFPGLPRGKGNRIRIRSPKDQPYLPVVKEVPTWKALSETALDADLERGVWVDVVAKDKATGKPIPGSVSYFVLPEKVSKNPVFDRPFADAYRDFMPIRTDGTFRFAGVHRRAILAFRTDADIYPPPPEAATMQLPGSLPAINFQGFAEINPQANDISVKAEIVLDTGGVVKGKLVDLDGQPVSGALAVGLGDDWSELTHPDLKTAEFTVLGLNANRRRLVCFVHGDKKLAGSIVVRGKENSRVTVKLAPWGTVSGRLLDKAGKPIKNARLTFTELPPRKSGQPMSLDTGLFVVYRSPYKPYPEPRTDSEGRFQVDRLVPRLKYNLALYDPDGAISLEQVKWLGLAFSNLVLQPGETKDLGDLKLEPLPKK